MNWSQLGLRRLGLFLIRDCLQLVCLLLLVISFCFACFVFISTVFGSFSVFYFFSCLVIWCSGE